MTKRAHSILLSTIVAGGALLRLAIAWLPAHLLLRRTVPDDTFYYLAIARNIAQGLGFTFDRLAPTNGYHPLWMGIITPIFLLTDDRALALHLVLTLCAIIDTASLHLLYRLLRELNISRGASLATAALYAFSPTLLSHVGAMNGLETSLTIFILLLYLRIYFRSVAKGIASFRALLSLAAVTLLLFLARTDMVVVIAVSYAHMWIARGGGAAPKDRSRSRMTLAAMLAALGSLPWLLWSYLRWGTIVQVSGLSVAYMTREETRANGWGVMRYVGQALRNMIDVGRYVPFPHILYSKYAVIIPALIMLLALLAPWMRRRMRRDDDAGSEIDRFIAPIAIATLLYIAVQTMRAVFIRAWYYAPFAMLLLIPLARAIDIGIEYVTIRAPRARLMLGCGAAIIVAAAYAAGYAGVLELRSRDEVKYLHVVPEMNRVLPGGSRVGAWNAGIYGYFFDRGDVVNLDGLVNNVAYGHIMQRSLAAYCDSVGIGYLVDDVSTLRSMSRYWRNGAEDIAKELEIMYAAPVPVRDTTVIGREDRRDEIGDRKDEIGDRRGEIGR